MSKLAIGMMKDDRGSFGLRTQRGLVLLQGGRKKIKLQEEVPECEC